MYIEGGSPAKDAFFPLHTAMGALTEEVAMNITPTVTQKNNWALNKTEGIFLALLYLSDSFLTLREIWSMIKQQ